MFKLFKRKFKNEYKKAINYKIAHPETMVLCPKCKKTLMYYEVGNSAEVRCASKKCITGNSNGIYGFQRTH